MKKYFIKTFGCQMNENDSEILAGILESKGYFPALDVKDADVILTNTCSVRDGAERKANGFIHYLNKLKRKKKDLIIGVVGCMAERMKEEILKKFKFVDFVLGPREERKLEGILKTLTPPSTLPRLPRLRSGQAARDRSGSPLSLRERVINRNPSTNAWIKIMEGCNNYCSYCIVPYVRGREESRPINDILNEIESLDKNVFKEVTLLGQNVNSYEFDFSKLLNEVSKTNGILRVRFVTSHPKDMTDEIINAVAQNAKICECFHIPLQSGDDEILKKMNRGYSRDYYFNLIKKIRDKIPNASITSDIIVGFPGESEEQFNNSLDMVSKIEFDAVNTLAFDPRPKTKAYDMKDRVLQEIIKKRLYKLMDAVEKTALQRNRKLLGTNQEILIDQKNSGRTRTNKIVKLNDSEANLIGELVNAKITSAGSWVLQGEIVD